MQKSHELDAAGEWLRGGVLPFSFLNIFFSKFLCYTVGSSAAPESLLWEATAGIRTLD